MITHNGKYLWAATHHGMPIVAATMGGKKVIGGWLLSATKQAIVAAFGSAEGTEVIAKTNDYLNRIAQTDPQRVLQISGFINEDPMLVCSLVETSKMRWLSSDASNAFIDFGITWSEANYTLDIEFRHLHNQSSNQVYIFGSQLWSGSALLIHDRIDPPYSLYPNKGSYTEVGDGSYIVKMASNSGNTAGGNNKVTLMGGNISQKGLVRISYFKGTIGTNVYNIVPFNGADRIGMLDLDNFQFYPNANTEGSFTIALTDKTPA